MHWSSLAALHFVPTAFMTGLVWFVQAVHYPLFARVGAREFADYEREHTRRTTWVVLPAMIAELGLALWLVAAAPAEQRALAIAGAALLLGIWASTFWVQVPCHDRLLRGPDPRVLRRLVRSNWLRTAAWSLRLSIATALVWPAA